MENCANCGWQLEEHHQTCPSCETPRQVQSSDIDIDKNKGMAALAYILFFVPLLMGLHKESDFVKFHVNQGAVVFVAAVGLNIISTVVTTFLWRLYPLNTMISLAFSLLSIAIGILGIIGIVAALQGQKKELPIIGKFKILN